jgi:hypothetical protein
MSSLSSEVAFTPTPAATAVQPGRRPRAAARRQCVPQTLPAEDVARTLVRLQMRIRELEAELTALRAAPSGWR